MRRHWTQPLPDGATVECRLPWWYPWALRAMGLAYALRGRYPDDARLIALRSGCLQVRTLPDGRWMRWRDHEAARSPDRSGA